MQISVFPHAKEVNSVTVERIEDVFSYIKNGRSKQIIEKIRSKTNALKELKKNSLEYDAINEQKQSLKRKLPSIVFQGIFTKRAKTGLVTHSELATIDFDHLPEPEKTRDFLFKHYKQVFAAFISPSADGVKIIVRIPKVSNDDEYKEYYLPLLSFFDSAKNDTSTKDISRICFESFDPDIKIRKWEETLPFTQRLKKDEIYNEPVRTEKINVKGNETDIANIARQMIRRAPDGEKHYTLLKAGTLMGGFVASGEIAESEAINILETEIKQRNIKSLKDAQDTIKDAIAYGKGKPITNFSFKDFTQEAIKTPKLPAKIQRKPFPVEIYPESLQTIIKETNRCLNFPVDYTASGILAVFSTLIRNSLKLTVKRGWDESACLWIMQVGEPGTVKSHPLTKLFYPLKRIDEQLNKQYEEELDQWEAIEKKGKKPKMLEILIDELTIEQLAKSLNNNPAGLGLYKDELKGWIEGMGQYKKKSNDIQTYLSIFSNKGFKVTRKSEDRATHVSNPFLTVIGTIQPDELITINANHIGDGFFDRFLFAYPDAKMSKQTKDEIDINVFHDYNETIEMTFKAYNDIISKYSGQILHFSEEGKEQWYKTDDWLVDLAGKETTNAALQNYISKLRTYLPRLSLVMEVIDCTYQGFTPVDVTKKSVVNATKLIQYFYINAEMIYSKFTETKDIRQHANHTNKGKTKQQVVYEMKESGISVNDIAKHFQCSVQTIYTHLSREKERKKA